MTNAKGQRGQGISDERDVATVDMVCPYLSFLCSVPRSLARQSSLGPVTDDDSHMTAKSRSVPFLALPSAPVLVVGIARFDEFQTGQTDEDPKPAFVMPNAVKRIVDLATSLASLGADTFDGQVNCLVDRDSGSGRSRTPASPHASFRDPRSFRAIGERKTALIRTASSG